jgi:hypothetical protein
MEKPLAPVWVFKLMNPSMKALLQLPLHPLFSGTLMLITYKGRKSGKVYIHPIGYFEWGPDELLAFTSARWWVNMLGGAPVRLLVKGRWLEAVPTIIRERAAVIETVKEFIWRIGLKPALRLALGLPRDREPTPDDFCAIPPSRTIVIFKVVRPAA